MSVDRIDWIALRVGGDISVDELLGNFLRSRVEY